jgi:hypothetical protein
MRPKEISPLDIVALLMWNCYVFGKEDETNDAKHPTTSIENMKIVRWNRNTRRQII